MKLYGGNRFFRSLMPFIGSVIGVGIFGLPYVFAQSGFLIGLVHLFVIGLVNLIVLLLYADIVMNSKGQARLTGYVRTFLGEHWSWLATAIAFGTNWGAMLAYTIIGGSFLHAIFSPLIGGGITFYQFFFFAVSSLLLIGGLGFIAKLETVFVAALLLILFLVITGSLPYIEPAFLFEVNVSHWFLPFGVVLFAYGGFAAIPEMADVLGKDRSKLRKAIILGTSIIAFVYLAFAGVVVAVTGLQTSEEAILGLGAFVGDWVTLIGSLMGFISVFTSFLILGISIMDTMIYDYKIRYFSAWGLTIIIPLLLFIAGARSFISVIGYTGGILGSAFGLMVIFLYLRARKHVCMPKRCLRFPPIAIYFSAAVFILGAILTIAGIR